MNKVLVIKGADFSDNYLTQVTFSDIACTGITFDESTYVLSGFGTTEIGYSVTPINTTDTVEWSSSDTDVISVDDGIMTVVGIGSCIVTAICGGYSATATITVSISCSPSFAFANFAHPTGKTYVQYTNNNYKRISGFGAGNGAGNLVVPSTNSAVLSPYAIRIPRKTTKIRINGSGFYNDINKYNNMLYFIADTPCGDVSYPNAPTYVSGISFNAKTELPLEVDVPNGADSFVFHMRPATDSASTDNPANIAEALNISVDFLTV